jgi:molecular chaperone GrpE (heat shock protein)
MHQVWKWIKSLFVHDTGEVETDKLKREIQGLSLELEECDRSAKRLKDLIAHQREGSASQITESVQSKMEQLLSELATPITQIMTQAHLVDVDKETVATRDVIVLVKRMVRVLEDHGMELEGQVGDVVPFDPDQHESLSAEVSPIRGERVVVRFRGVSYKGVLLRKAGIDKVGI